MTLWFWIKETSFSRECGGQSGSSCALPLQVNHRPNRNSHDLHSQQEDVSTLGPRQEEGRSLLAQQQAQQMGTLSAQAVESHHHPELSLPSWGLSFRAAPPKFLLFLCKVTSSPLFAGLAYSFCYSMVAILCYSQINIFCWWNNWLF